MKTDSDIVSCSDKIGFVNDICADGICCFMSIPRKQTHLGIGKLFFRRRNASYGIKLFYTGCQVKDIVYDPCKCLSFSLKELKTSNGSNLQVLLRCGIFGKRYRPYTCKKFPDKADSFMHDIPAPCVYNEYIASKEYVELKHKQVFRLFYAIRDNRKVLGNIFPGYTAEEARKRLNLSTAVVKISALWNAKKPSEYFLLEVPKIDSILYTSDAHPRIEGVKQSYDFWQGHLETWIERHYGNKWQEYLNRALEQEKITGAKK